MADVSVIIPCFNSEKYVDCCLHCLEKQTIGFKNLEIIIINDGSNDGTLDKLLEWEGRYPERIIVITYDENCKQGAARNIGISYATAEYIGFLDVDDIIAEDFYEKLFSRMKMGKYDWVSTKFMHISRDQEPEFQKPVYKKDKEYHCGPEEVLLFSDFEKGMNNGSFGVLPAMLFRKEFIVGNKLYFPEGLMYEDNYWYIKCNIFAKDIYIIDEVLYCYYMNLNSTVSKRHTNHHLDRMKIEMMNLKLFKEEGLLELYHDKIEIYFIKMYYCNTWYAVFLKMDYIPNIFPEMRQVIKETFPDFMKNPYLKDLPELDYALLTLLTKEEDYTVEELVYVKQAVLDYMELK